MTPVILDARVLAGSGGGPDKTIINSPRYLADAGYKMLCAYLHDPADQGYGVLQIKARAKGVGLISIADHGKFDYRVVHRMLDVCKQENVTIWHGHDYKTNLLGLILNRFRPMRLVTTLHGWVHHTRLTPIYYRLDRMSLRYYEKVIAVSPDLYEAARKAKVPAANCLLLENGIDLADYRPTSDRAVAKQVIGMDPRKIVIGAAGRLSSEKGFDILIDAVDHLLGAGHDVQAFIAGEGVEKDSLQRRIIERNRADRIRLVGYQADLRPYYAAMDIFALSSHREGLPNVLLEAMAMEVPIVSTAVNGIPRLVRDNIEGRLVSSGSAEALAAGIDALLRDPAGRHRMAKTARATVESRYSFAVRMEKLTRVYDEMLRSQVLTPAMAVS